MGSRKRSNPLLKHVVTRDGKQYTEVRPFEYVERNDYSMREGMVHARRVPHAILPDRTGAKNAMRVLSMSPHLHHGVKLDGPTRQRDVRIRLGRIAVRVIKHAVN